MLEKKVKLYQLASEVFEKIHWNKLLYINYRQQLWEVLSMIVLDYLRLN